MSAAIYFLDCAFQDLTSEGTATLPRDEHLVITPAPSDQGSSASVDEAAALTGRKRSLPRPWEETRGPHVQVSLPRSFRTELGGSTLNTAPVRRTCLPTHIPAMAQGPEPPQVQINPVTVSHATPDMLNVAAAHPPFVRYRPILSFRDVDSEPATRV
jgi:hypothetical protein